MIQTPASKNCSGGCWTHSLTIPDTQNNVKTVTNIPRRPEIFSLFFNNKKYARPFCVMKTNQTNTHMGPSPKTFSLVRCNDVSSLGPPLDSYYLVLWKKNQRKQKKKTHFQKKQIPKPKENQPAFLTDYRWPAADLPPLLRPRAWECPWSQRWKDLNERSKENLHKYRPFYKPLVCSFKHWCFLPLPPQKKSVSVFH